MAGGATPSNNARIFNLTAETIAALMPVRTDWYGPGATRVSSTQVRLVARGANDALYVRVIPGGAWVQIPGTVAKSDPEVTSAGTGRIDTFAQGADGATYHVYSANSGATWFINSLGGIATSAPAAVSWDTGRLDVFARGTTGALFQNTSTNSGVSWSGWASRGGILTSDPDVSTWGTGRLDVYARGADNALWHMAFASGAWQPWESLGGTLTSSPGAVSWGVNRADVVARGRPVRISVRVIRPGRFSAARTRSSIGFRAASHSRAPIARSAYRPASSSSWARSAPIASASVAASSSAAARPANASTSAGSVEPVEDRGGDQLLLERTGHDA